MLLNLNFQIDGFRIVYGTIILLMWACTLLFSPEYFKHHENKLRYYIFNIVTLFATLGVFMAGDFYTAFIFFEIMSFTSYVWVIQEETQEARKAAETYLGVAVIGGMVALMGLFLLQHEVGTTNFALLREAAAAGTLNMKTMYVAGGCILFGFGAKAGMFPLHIWLPKAHPVAPAPASALLSGILTKSGVFGILGITCNVFAGNEAWSTVILVLGTITMVWGAILALFSINLKRTLACSSMSQIGFILIGIGMMTLLGEEGTLAARGTLLHMMNHSLFKLVLFICAGVVFMNLHELDLNKIRGFGRKKPFLMFSFLMGAIGIGGIPLWSGYVSKTLLHEGIVEGIAEYGNILRVVEWAFLISGGITLAYMTKLFVCVFIEKNPTRQEEYDGKKKYMNVASRIALCIPAVIIPVIGALPELTMDKIADFGTDFMHYGVPEESINYFSLENLKGAGISMAVALFVYLVIVRKILMKNGEYLARGNKRIDLETMLYRPLIQRWLPNVLGAFAKLFGENIILTPVCKAIKRFAEIVSHLFSDSLDAVILLLGKTVFKTAHVKTDDKIAADTAYKIGKRKDIKEIKNGNEEEGGHEYADLFYRRRKTIKHTTGHIMGSLSFALLMLCIALCGILVYMLVIR